MQPGARRLQHVAVGPANLFAMRLGEGGLIGGPVGRQGDPPAVAGGTAVQRAPPGFHCPGQSKGGGVLGVALRKAEQIPAMGPSAVGWVGFVGQPGGERFRHRRGRRRFAKQAKIVGTHLCCSQPFQNEAQTAYMPAIPRGNSHHLPRSVEHRQHVELGGSAGRLHGGARNASTRLSTRSNCERACRAQGDPNGWRKEPDPVRSSSGQRANGPSTLPGGVKEKRGKAPLTAIARRAHGRAVLARSVRPLFHRTLLLKSSFCPDWHAAKPGFPAGEPAQAGDCSQWRGTTTTPVAFCQQMGGAKKVGISGPKSFSAKMLRQFA